MPVMLFMWVLLLQLHSSDVANGVGNELYLGYCY
jgi:hypothetical protein